MYLLGRAAGFPAQDELWGYLADGLRIPIVPEPDDWGRMRALMRQDRDTPMDLADASLVAAAERVASRRMFTLDRHFHAYSLHDGQAFAIVP